MTVQAARLGSHLGAGFAVLLRHHSRAMMLYLMHASSTSATAVAGADCCYRRGDTCSIGGAEWPQGRSVGRPQGQLTQRHVPCCWSPLRSHIKQANAFHWHGLQ
jgi:hypothetical protein